MFIKRSEFLNALALTLQFVVLMTMLVTGYLVAPVLFANLTAKVAGDIAGILFNITAYIALVSFLIMAVLYKFQQRSGFLVWSNLLNLVIMLLAVFWLTPWMAEIKSSYPQGLSKESADWALFASLHGVYQLAYLVVMTLILIGIFKQFNFIKKAL